MNKVTFITGAVGGIGKAIAEYFAKRDYRFKAKWLGQIWQATQAQSLA